MKAENLFNQSKFDLYAAYLKSTGLSDASLKRKLSSLANFQKYLVKKNLITPVETPRMASLPIDQNPYPTLGGVKKKSPSLREGLGAGLQNLQNKKLFSYLLIASLLIISSAIGYGFYRQSIKQAKSGFAYSTASSPVYANRFLSFQGRLTDSSGNPITSSVSIQFDLFNTEAVGTGTSLYSSATGNSQVVVPDENGIFSVTIGKTHGTEIPNSVFTENPAVYLQITAGSETMSPRQPIATVAYAINAETLQGLPPSASGTKDTVLVVDSLGNLNLGETSPTIKSTSGTLGIEGQAVLIKATDGSGGNIEINPDANGIIKLTTEGSGSTAVNGFIDATNANLSTGNLYSATIRNDNRGYNFLDFRNYDTSTTNLTTKFSVDASGNTFIGGTLSPTTISIGNTILTSSAYELNLLDGTLATAGSLIYGNGSKLVNTSVGTSGQLLMSNGSSSPFWINSDTVGKTYTAGNGLSLVSNTFSLNLGSTNVWTALQTFTNGIGVTGNLNVTGNITATGAIRNVTVNGVTNTAIGTTAKDVTISTSNYSLTTGDLLSITFTNGNSASAITLNIGGTVVSVRLNNTNVVTSTFTLTAGATVLMYYDGTYFQVMGSQDTSDSDTTDRTFWNNAITAGTAIYDYKLLMQSSDGKWYPLTFDTGTGTTKVVSTTEFTVNSPIIYYNSTTDITTNGTLSNVYSEYPVDRLNYTANQASWTNQLPIYLKGTINTNGNFVLDNTSFTSFLTQSLPTTDDGFVYILLGQMYSTANMRLHQYHPIYQYKFGKVQVYNPNSDLFVLKTGDTISGNLNIGGTLTLPQGAVNNYVLTSDASGNARWAVATGNTYTAGVGLTLSSGNVFSLNLGSTNVWTALQTFTNGIGVSNTANLSGNLNVGGTAYFASNVGIGTTDISGKLTVAGSSGSGRSVSIDNREIKFRGDGVAHMSIFGPDTGNSFITFQNTSANSSTGTAGTDLFTIMSSGNVGIGTTNPSQRFQITTSGSTDIQYGIRLQNPNTSTSGTSTGIAFTNDTDNNLAKGGLIYTARSGYGRGDFLFLQNSNADTTVPTLGDAVMAITNAGNVGIGTTSPSKKLDIIGDGSFSTNLNVGGTLTLSQGANNGYILTSDSSGNARWAAASGGSTYTADNGLTLSGSVFKLGGTLTEDTNIGTSSFSLSFQPSGTAPVLKLLNVDGSTNLEFRTSATNQYNTFIGLGVGQTNTSSGTNNTGLGYYALSANTTGNENTAIGGLAMTGNTFGAQNVAVGVATLTSPNVQYYNTAVGAYSMQNNGGMQNTALGHYSLNADTTGSGNVALGANTFRFGSNLNNNIAIGFGAGAYLSSGSNNIFLGTGIGDSGDYDNRLYIGNSSLTTIYGDLSTGNVGIGTTNPGYKLTVAGNGSFSTNLNVGGTLTLAQGATDGYLLKSDASGNSSWVDPSTLGLGTTYAAGNGLTLSSNTFSLNLGSTNVWTALQTFTNGIGVTGTTNLSGSLNVGDTAYFDSKVNIGTTAPWSGLNLIVDGHALIDSIYLNNNQIFSSNSDLTLMGGGGTTVRNNINLGNGYGGISLNAGTDSAENITLDTRSNGGFILLNGGNVGINTTNPTSKLHVIGDGYFSTNLSIGGTFLSVGSTNLVTNLNANYLNGLAYNNLPYVDDTTDSTLTRSGSGPYTLALNLGSTNTWTALQTFTNGIGVTGTTNLTNNLNVGSTAYFANLVGIGTSSPLAPLHVGTTAIVSVGGTTVSNLSSLFTGSIAALRYYDADNSQYFIDPAVSDINHNSIALTNLGSIKFNVNDTTANNQYWTATSASRIQSYANGLSFDVGTSASIGIGNTIVWNNNLFLATSGNVGIGTTAPNHKLSIGGASSLISNDSGDITLNAASNNISFAGDSLINVNNAYFSGNVGIGLTNPSYKLDVYGSINIGDTSAFLRLGTGRIRFNIGTTQLEYSNDDGANYLAIGSGSGGSQYGMMESDWVSTGTTLPGNLYYSQTSVIGNYVYLFGGYTTATTNIIYRAPTSNPTAWVNTGSTIPASIYISQSAIIGDYVYLFGGSNGSSSVNTIYRAPTSNPTAWTNTGSTLPATLSGSRLAVINSYVYLFGGITGTSTTNVIYRAPTSNPTAWVNTGSTIPGNLRTSQSAIIGDYVYLFGGFNGSAITNVIYRAPVSSPTSWVNTGKTLPATLNDSSIIVVGNYVYLLGGSTGSSISNIYEAPISNPTNWTSIASILPGNLSASSASIIGNYVYLFGGYNTAVTNVIYRTSIYTGSPVLTSNPSWKYLANGSGSGSGGISSTNGNLSIGGTLTLTQGASNGYLLVSDASGNSRWANPATLGLGSTYAAYSGLTLSSGNFSLGGTLFQNTDIGFSGFNLTFSDSGSTLASFNSVNNTFYNPTTFASAGDVSMAYDLNFTNSTGSNLNSSGPLSINSGEIFGSSNLTLQTYNAGKLIINSSNLYSNGTNFGIGTTAPIYKFQVHQTTDQNLATFGNFNLSDGIMLQSVNDTASTIKGFEIRGSSVRLTDTTTSGLILTGGNVGIGTTNPTGPLQINIGTTQALFVSSIGYVGIGMTAPDTKLCVWGGAIAITGSGVNGTLVLDTVAGTSLLGTNTNTNGIAINSSGNVGIGMTAPTYKLQVNGNSANTTGVWTNYSDIRLKNSITSIDNSLETILQLNPVSFNWNDPIKNAEYGRVRGFIAQDVEKVVPEWVVTDSTGYKALQTIGMDAMLVESIKELNTKIENKFADLSDLSVTSTGQINVNYNISPEVLASLGYSDSKNEIESATYNLTDSLGNTVTRISQFAEIAAAKIKAGLVSTTNLIADNAAIKNLKSNKITTDEIISPSADVGSLKAATATISGTLTANNIQTTQVTTENLTANEASVSSLVAENIQAEKLETDKLTASEASVSTLYADQIISKEGSFTDIMANKISSLRQELTDIVAKNEESTPSAIALESDKWSINVATDSAILTGDLSLTDNLIVGAQLMVNGDSQFGNAFVTGQFTAGEVSIQDNFIATSNSALYIQPNNTGSVHIMGDTLVVADNGEVKINGNLTVAGSVFANLLQASEIETQKLTAAEATIDDLRSTKLNIATDSGTIIANSNDINIATASSQLTSNATAGTATLPTGKTELIISTSKITANSMVYLTPVGSTSNQVLYVKEKTADHFTVALDQPLDHDVNINWWIIN